jgi:hypothetical protein
MIYGTLLVVPPRGWDCDEAEGPAGVELALQAEYPGFHFSIVQPRGRHQAGFCVAADDPDSDLGAFLRRPSGQEWLTAMLRFLDRRFPLELFVTAEPVLSEQRAGAIG